WCRAVLFWTHFRFHRRGQYRNRTGPMLHKSRPMLSLLGSEALTPARRAKVLAERAMRERNPEVRSVSAQFLHLVDLEEPLSNDERGKLEALLRYGPRTGSPDEEQTLESGGRIVVPRFGTISPWSSKATDILHACNLKRVR